MAKSTEERLLTELARVAKIAADAQAKRDRLILQAHDSNIMPKEIAEAAGVTRGRVHQILTRLRSQ